MKTCDAELHIGDDLGDNFATMKCQLHAGHNGPHQEIFKRGKTPVLITYECDERAVHQCNERAA